MYFEHRTFSLAKDTRRPAENQDACAVDAVRGIAAIADGVSSTLFAGRWAQLLVERVLEDPPAIIDAMEFSAWLAQQRAVWQSEIDETSLAWHQKPKLAQGAATTLLWIELSPTDSLREFALQSFAVGDCCLFHVQGDRVRRAFPIESSGGYDTDPPFIGSVGAAQPKSLPIQTLADTCASGDLIVLCTDAIAVWALEELEAGRSPQWESFWSMSPDEWRAKIEMLRTNNRIRYDDTTVVLLRIAEPRATQHTQRPADLTSDLKQTAKRVTSWLRGTSF
jgi:hypothetical protein